MLTPRHPRSTLFPYTTLFRSEEVATIAGVTADGRIETVRIVPEGSEVANYGFDITPARLVTGLITERGVISPDRKSTRLNSSHGYISYSVFCLKKIMRSATAS